MLLQIASVSAPCFSPPLPPFLFFLSFSFLHFGAYTCCFPSLPFPYRILLPFASLSLFSFPMLLQIASGTKCSTLGFLYPLSFFLSASFVVLVSRPRGHRRGMRRFLCCIPHFALIASRRSLPHLHSPTWHTLLLLCTLLVPHLTINTIFIHLDSQLWQNLLTRNCDPCTTHACTFARRSTGTISL